MESLTGLVTGKQKKCINLLFLRQSVLGGLLRDEEYHIWILVARLTELIFGAGRDGWTQEMLDLARNLILRHNIFVEETQGLKSCHVTLHNLVHIVDDTERFSSPDNFGVSRI